MTQPEISVESPGLNSQLTTQTSFSPDPQAILDDDIDPLQQVDMPQDITPDRDDVSVAAGRESPQVFLFL
jgi:hypothetical protein